MTQPKPQICSISFFLFILLPNFLIIIFIFFPLPTSHAKSVIEPCDASDSCFSLLSYVLPWDSSLSDIAFRFQVNISSLLGSNSLDPTTPWPGNQILPKHSVVKVPVSCSCVSGIRQAPLTYTIRACDTLDSISNSFGGLVSADQINSVNSKINGFIEGRKIFVPLPCTCFGNVYNGLACVYMSYVVQQGESVTKVAAKYGITVRDLESVNGVDHCNVDPGDILAVPLPGCSSANLKWRNDTLIIPNNTYALRANDCIVCSCGPNNLNLHCSISGIGNSCSHLQCKGSDLLIGQVYETPTTTCGCKTCNVSKCVYRGYSGDKIYKSLMMKSHIRCSGHKHNGIAISPKLPWQHPFNSCSPSFQSTVGINISSPPGKQVFKYYSSHASSYHQANFQFYRVISIFLVCQYFVL